MGYQWHQTKHEGVRYREHPTRRHGVKLDQYYVIRYRVDGKRHEEGLGWASQGWTAQRASLELAKLKEAHRTGEGAATLAEKRQKASDERKAREEKEAMEARDAITMACAWDRYRAVAQGNMTPRTFRTDGHRYNLWIMPSLGSTPIKDIAPIHLEHVKKAMLDAGRAAQTIRHVLAIVSRVINFAKAHGLYSGDNAVSKVKKPMADARRVRFLTPEEARNLLEALKSRSVAIHDMALLALNGGLRVGEIFGLTWPDVDFGNGVLTLRDTKNGKTRQVPMTASVQSMLEAKKKQSEGGLEVFTTKPRDPMSPDHDPQVSVTYSRAVEDLGLNAGVEDRRHKVVFHTLRHTYASWLVQKGVPLITVGRLLGHSSLVMTERYSHLAPDHFRQAVDTLETIADRKPARRQKPVRPRKALRKSYPEK